MKTAKPISTAFVVLAGLATASPLYAHKAPQSSPGMTMPGGGMQDMMGMMGMMQQMNTMMTLCTNMMQASMPGTGGGQQMPMPQQTPEAPKQGG